MSFQRRLESSPIQIRAFSISGFLLTREQAWIPAYAGMSAPVSVYMSGRCKSSPGERHAPVTESNCVTVR